jgi:hypothetical protein
VVVVVYERGAFMHELYMWVLNLLLAQEHVCPSPCRRRPGETLAAAALVSFYFVVSKEARRLARCDRRGWSLLTKVGCQGGDHMSSWQCLCYCNCMGNVWPVTMSTKATPLYGRGFLLFDPRQDVGSFRFPFLGIGSSDTSSQSMVGDDL